MRAPATPAGRRHSESFRGLAARYPHSCRAARATPSIEVGGGSRGRARSCRSPAAGPGPSERSGHRLGRPVLPGRRAMPSTAATASGTAAGSVTAANSKNHTPSGNSSANRAATSIASRVLPTPPTPVNVTNRRVRTADCSSPTSDSRPINPVTAAGEFPGLIFDRPQRRNSALRPDART